MPDEWGTQIILSRLTQCKNLTLLNCLKPMRAQGDRMTDICSEALPNLACYIRSFLNLHSKEADLSHIRRPVEADPGL